MKANPSSAVVLLMSAALLLAACAGEPAASPDDQPTAMAGVPEAFQFSTVTLNDGAEFDGESLLGHATILWFWAGWCGACEADAKYILGAIPDLPEGVQIIGVPTLADEAAMRAFAEANNVYQVTNIMDEDGAISRGFGLPTLPSIAVIYEDGYTATIPGALTTEKVLEIAEKIAPAPAN